MLSYYLSAVINWSSCRQHTEFINKEVILIKVQKINPLYEQIYNNIKEAILNGELEAGTRMVDSWFAEKLGVSRSPVREAFRKLEQDGLLVNQEGTTLVYNPNVNDVIELFEVRAGLEGMAVFLATSVITDEEIEELSYSIKQVKKALMAQEVQKIIQLNTFFHESIVKVSKNKRLLDIMHNISNLTRLYRNNFFKNNYVNDQFLEEHTEILEAIKARNPALASEKMRQHILHDLEMLIENLGDKQGIKS